MLNPMEEHEHEHKDDVRRPLAVTHLLQHTLRSLCNSHNHWVYAVFWRILPRNYPPPKWDGQAAYDRSRGNRRNWILVWEDGFCNFAASSSVDTTGLQPDLFFKMSHEIYNYGEGFIGKVAADHAHKWIYKEPNDHEINFLSSWHNSPDTQPRTWEAQFQSGIKTIALIAVREGVVQLGAVHKVIEDLSYVVFLRKKFHYIESIPGVLLPHPSSSSSYPFKVDGYAGIGGSSASASESDNILWQLHGGGGGVGVIANPNQEAELNNNMYDNFNNVGQLRITPSMSSLEALLSKLPSVVPPPHTSMEKVAKEEIHQLGLGQGQGQPETTTSFSSAYNRFPNTTSTTSNQKY